MSRGAQTASRGFAHSDEIHLRRERVVGDLDEVDMHRLEPVERRGDFLGGADLERALPARSIALELRTRSEDRGPEQGILGDRPTPREYVPGEIGGRVTDRGYTVRDVERQQRLVLGDQLVAATEVHVHVPEPRNYESAGGIDRVRGGVAPAEVARTDRYDFATADDDAAIRNQGASADVDDGRRADQQVGRLRRRVRGHGRLRQAQQRQDRAAPWRGEPHPYPR